MTQLTTLSGESSVKTFIKSTLPSYFKRATSGTVDNILSAFATAFEITISQINQMFNNTFISQATGTVLEDLITDISLIRRKDGESDTDYVERYYKYVFEYNCTVASIREQVYDVMGYYPRLIYEAGNRGAYWGEENLPLSGQVSGTAIYYNEENWEYKDFWSDESGSFTAYIYLDAIPPQDIIDELCNVIERVRLRGTTIYLVLPQTLQPPQDFIMYDIT